MISVELKLEKQARSSGGDKYTGTMPNEPRPFSVYVPQYYSRSPNGKPALSIKLTIEPIFNGDPVKPF